MNNTQKINKTWLLKSIQKIAKDSFEKTGHSLNGLPEYYVNVKLAEELIKANKNFELEYRTESLAAELGIDLPKNESKYRLHKGAIDLVVQSVKEWKSQHLIEIKRTSKIRLLRADLERLTWFVTQTQGIKRSLNKAYVILINPLSAENFKERTKVEEDYLRKEFGNESINLTFKTCELSDFNTRQASINSNANKSVNALIWEIKLKSL